MCSDKDSAAASLNLLNDKLNSPSILESDFIALSLRSLKPGSEGAPLRSECYYGQG
tara:strand:- start:23 stop:190 length:168 start_codon:yes stop_codon:yes gene_type:complete